jgi:two-component system copper resistance phosphate regulon response regulator CusR
LSRILIVEDEVRIASFIEKGLRANGFSTQVTGDAENALVLARTGSFDLLVLDLGLPDKDGIGDRVVGLEGGADDYITKPFRFDELLARVRVRLRVEHSAEPTVLRTGDAALDLRMRRAVVADRTVDLSAREFALAEVFFRHPGQVLSREQLLSQVWGYDFDPGSNIVDVYVGYLRKKLGKEVIASVRGMGYRLEHREPNAAA